MRSFIIAFILSVVGCASAELERVEAQEQFATTSHTVTNNTATIPWAADKFCHMIAAKGVGAHSVARVMNFGIPASGGMVSQGTPQGVINISAIPNAANWDWNNPPPGTMQATYDCQRYGDFFPNAGAWTGQATYQVDVPEQPVQQTPQLVNQSASNLFDVNSLCFVDGFSGVSEGNGVVDLQTFADPSVPPGQRWRLNVQGYEAISGTARCAHVGRNTTIGGWFSATPGSPVIAVGFKPSESTCFIHKIFGNADDADFGWRKNGFFWKLETLNTSGSIGGLSRVEGYCLKFAP